MSHTLADQNPQGIKIGFIAPTKRLLKRAALAKLPAERLLDLRLQFQPFLEFGA